MNLDDVVPAPQHVITQSRMVAASPDEVWDELLGVTMSALPLGLTLTRMRRFPAWLSGPRSQRLSKMTFLEETPIPILHVDRPRSLISAGLSQAWRPRGGATPPLLGPAALRRWSQPGWIKVGMEFRLESTAMGTCLTCETRVVAVDPGTRRLFAIYWFIISACSAAIRREVLRVVARRAESTQQVD